MDDAPDTVEVDCIVIVIPPAFAVLVVDALTAFVNVPHLSFTTEELDKVDSFRADVKKAVDDVHNG